MKFRLRDKEELDCFCRIMQVNGIRISQRNLSMNGKISNNNTHADCFWYTIEIKDLVRR